jgi:hypothetical protein
VRTGQVLMTTGPFVEIGVRTPAMPPGEFAGMGQEIAAATPEVSLKIKVQCPNWITLDQVQIWVNGECDPTLTMTREQQPAWFADGPVVFDRELALTLDRDCSLLVVALGHGPNLYRRSPKEPEVAQHVAVTNPIRVDRDGRACEPQSPLKDQVETAIEMLTPLSSKETVGPAKLRVHLINHGQQSIQRKLKILCRPSGIVTQDTYEVPYELAPGGKATADFELALTPIARTDAILGDREVKVTVFVLRDGQSPGVSPARRPIIVDENPQAMMMINQEIDGMDEK